MLRKISIANRLAPFSHESCVTALIPGSKIYVQVWPCFLTINIDERMKFKFTGPVEGFTVQQEIEKRRIRVFGKAKEGYFSYFLYGDGLSYDLVIDRAPKSGIEIDWRDDQNGREGNRCLKRGDAFHSEEFIDKLLPLSFPKLSLGMHKKQQFPDLLRRGDPKEIFPLLLAFGHSLPRADVPTLSQGVLSLVEQEKWNILFQFCFEGLLYPKIDLEKAPEYLYGFSLPKRDDCHEPLSILSECAHKILSYFLQNEGDSIQILPALPKELTSGRLIDADVGNFSIDLEWTKNKPRRMIVEAKEGGAFPPCFSKRGDRISIDPSFETGKGEKDARK